MKHASLFVLALAGALALGACSTKNDTATVQFDITDAPVASASIKEVYVTFSSLAVNESTSAGTTARAGRPSPSTRPGNTNSFPSPTGCRRPSVP
jgi:hypothetical protein